MDRELSALPSVHTSASHPEPSTDFNIGPPPPYDFAEKTVQSQPTAQVTYPEPEIKSFVESEDHEKNRRRRTSGDSWICCYTSTYSQTSFFDIWCGWMCCRHCCGEGQCCSAEGGCCEDGGCCDCGNCDCGCCCDCGDCVCCDCTDCDCSGCDCGSCDCSGCDCSGC